MPYIFPDSLVPPAGRKFPLIGQLDIKGSLFVVSKLSELNTLKEGLIKKGMLISVANDKGALYECSDIVSSYDEDDNEIKTPVFRPFFSPTETNTSGDAPRLFQYRRPQKTINFSYIAEGSVVNLPIDMGCKSFVITKVEVAKDRLLQLKIFSTLLRKDDNPYEFSSTRQAIDSGFTRLKNKQNFQYRKFHTCVNKETAKVNQTKFIFQCTSLEKGSYTTQKGLTWKDAEIVITYIPLEA